jgi:hypothetical protein
MNGRFASAVVALAVATAIATHAKLLPEFLIQLGDRNLIGGSLFSYALAHFGYAFVLALCSVMAAAATLLVGWRARTRGATDWHAALAATLFVLCIISRAGVSLDPVGWLCAAAFCLLLDRDDNASVVNALAIVAVWSLVQGGATLAALLSVTALFGTWIDCRRFDAPVLRKALVAIGAIVLGTLQLHAAPWHAYGAHALYLDALWPGAQRDRIWSGGLTIAGAGFAALVTVGAWYGVRRRSRSADAAAFFALLLLALADARNLPYFGIVAAPVVADAVASYYLASRTYPAGSARQYFVTFCACAFAFIAIITSTEPKVTIWPQAPGEPAALLSKIGGDGHAHTLLCEEPRWCDGAALAFPRVRPLLDDRAGIAVSRNRRVQSDAIRARGNWQHELRIDGVDAVIARREDAIVALLTASGWRERSGEGARVLLTPENER